MAVNWAKVSFFLALVMTVEILTPSVVSGENGFSDLRIRTHLKRLNKPALKSIKSPDGDIIDCVPITDQPAFGHPLLNNHTVQMWPSLNPEKVFSESKISSRTKSKQSNALTQLWHANGKCPKNTIPIRRTRKQDLYRASSVENYGMKNQKSIPKPKSSEPPNVLTQNGHQHAIMYVEDGVFYGAKAKINVWKPDVEMPNEFSLAQIWVLGGNFNSDLNSIEAGWQVSPQLYGDNRTRLFTYWTSDAYQGTGCYNLLCSGFVQINREIAMGGSISPLSNYGNSQYDITILIWKMRPKSVSIRDKTGDNRTDIIHQLWRTKGECPENTIPIRRRTRDDLLRSDSIENYGRKIPPIISPTTYHLHGVQKDVHEHACVYIDYGEFHGSKSRISIWKPNVPNTNEFSLAQTWVVNGDWDTGLNTLESGWQILHAMYGDNKPRLFAFWTSDSYQKNSCYNLDCPGFVQVNRDIALGAALNTISTYNGDQFDFLLTIEKEQDTGLWWLKFETYVVGYWPSFIVPKLANSARMIAWGGEIVHSASGGTHTLTQMGSGHFAEAWFKKAAYFNSIAYIDKSNYPITPFPQNLEVIVTRPECYNLKVGSSRRWGTYMFYGGPGHNPRSMPMRLL